MDREPEQRPEPNPPEASPLEDPLAEEIAARIDGGAGAAADDTAFDRLARAVFAAQFEACAPYRAWCERRGRTPERVRHWSEVPAVPVSAFREVELRSDGEPVARVFETSGTTGERRGRHFLSARALVLYDRSLLAGFRHALLPELADDDAGSRSALRAVILGPPASEAPHSSLYYMCERACRALVREEPRFLLGPGGLDLEGLRAVLAAAEREGRPLLLLGTALAWVEACARLAERYALPPGSRAMETGGTKGAHTSLAPRALRERIAERLGLPEAAIVGEYGMTEACSQWYDVVARAALESCPYDEPEADETPAGERYKRGPPWARAVLCDPESLEPAAPGAVGVVRIVDLANRFTISFLQTEDLAVVRAGDAARYDAPGTQPFALLGRARGAEARGCSLVAEEWARMTRDG